MAYYVSRVDNEGNELERRPSVRSVVPSMCSSFTESISSRSTFIPQNSERSFGTKSIIRYVNPAAYIEKSGNEDCDQSVSSEDLTIQSSVNLVPSLDLQSEDNYTKAYISSGVPKINTDNEVAYKTWQSAKQKLLSVKTERLRLLEKQKELEKKKRSMLAKENFDMWMQKKQEQEMEEKQNEKEKKKIVSKPRIQISAEEAHDKIKQWENKKRLEEEERRELKRVEEKRLKQWEEQRRNMSEEAWKKWVAEAANKPKPVPLNRGIFTLRGTISDIYVNPNEWQQLSPEGQ